MVANKPTFADSGDAPKIKKLFEDENVVVVAHNAPFDLMIIKKESIIPKNFICTLRLARHLDPEEKIEKYNLQYLRYFLDLDVEAQAHDAMGDVLVLEKLFDRLKKKIIEQGNLNDDEAIMKMIDISSHPSLFKSFKFGKHNGKQIDDVARIDRGYLEWLLTQKLESDEIDEDWIYTLKHYLGK
jgi:DNA polymerase III epsilon subunit-like protein